MPCRSSCLMKYHKILRKCFVVFCVWIGYNVISNEQCQIREMQKMTACRHFFVFFLFDRAVLGAGGTCLARTEVERRCPSVQWYCGLKCKKQIKIDKIESEQI